MQINSKLNEKNHMITYYWTWKNACGGFSLGRCFLKPFLMIPENVFKVSAQKFCHFMWYHWLRMVLIVFQPILIQNYIIRCVISTGVTLHCTAAIHNRVIFSCTCILWKSLHCSSAIHNRVIFSRILLRK